jgi:prohibitin 1
MVSITLRVLSRPDTDHLSKIYQGLGLDYDERVLPSIGNEVLKSIVAQFDAAELITQREVVGQRFFSSIMTHNGLLLAGVFTDSGGPARTGGRVPH